MTAQTLAHTITMQHGALNTHSIIDLQAEAPSGGLASLKRALRRADSLVVRIAFPPLAIWGTLYVLVEYMA